MFVGQQTLGSRLCFPCFHYLLPLFAFPSPTLFKKYELSSSSIFIMRGINACNPKWARWVHLARSGSQPEHRIRFILPTGAVSDVIITGIEDFAIRMVLIFRYRGLKVSLLPRLITTHVTRTDITDQGDTRAGEGWRENQELPDTMNDPLPLRTRQLSSLIYRLTKRWTNHFHPHHIQRKKKKLKAI